MGTIEVLAQSIENLTKLLNCCEVRERRHERLYALVKELGHDGVCWCQVGIGNSMMKGKHGALCDLVYRQVYGGARGDS